MSYQALARTWRPQNFSELVGQGHVRTALENALGRGKLHPALLFSGTRGVGKTTLARIIARCLNCETGVTATPCGQCSACTEIAEGRFVDLIEVDAASRTKVDETRELLDNVPYAPARGRYKIYLIDEVHMLTRHSFNALLKTLEEPPSHVQFLFATTDPQKLPITILSRCLQFHLKRIPAEEIGARIEAILKAESIEADAGGIRRLARAADGSLRDGLSLLDQAIAFGNGCIEDQAVATMLGSIERGELLALAKSVADNDAPAAFAIVEKIDEQGLDFAEVLDELCRLWQRLAVGQRVPEALDAAERAELEPLFSRFAAADLQVYYQIALTTRRDLDWAPDPRSGFEMGLLRTLAFLPDTAPAGSAGGGGGYPAPARPEAAAAIAETAAVRATAAPPTWPALRQSLGGPARVVADACELRTGPEGPWRLVVAAEVAALCTPPIEQQLRALISPQLPPGQVLEIEYRRIERARGSDPEAEFLAEPNIAKAIEIFDATLQPGSLRMADDPAGDSTTTH